MTLEPLPNYGVLHTLTEFKGMVRRGAVMDHDGYGFYATREQVSEHPARPSDIRAGRVNEDYAFVLWFNK